MARSLAGLAGAHGPWTRRLRQDASGAVFAARSGAPVIAAADLGHRPGAGAARCRRAAVVDDADRAGAEALLPSLQRHRRAAGASPADGARRRTARWPGLLPDLALAPGSGAGGGGGGAGRGPLAALLVKLFAIARSRSARTCRCSSSRHIERSFEAARRAVAELDAAALREKARDHHPLARAVLGLRASEQGKRAPPRRRLDQGVETAKPAMAAGGIRASRRGLLPAEPAPVRASREVVSTSRTVRAAGVTWRSSPEALRRRQVKAPLLRRVPGTQLICKEDFHRSGSAGRGAERESAARAASRRWAARDSDRSRPPARAVARGRRRRPAARPPRRWRTSSNRARLCRRNLP